ncbi:MAG: DUF1572 family protein [Gloeobacteraceae cyanobacterium ES-bin-316]|nr:DUF1572 family protein [Ferruginibacter sp.]
MQNETYLASVKQQFSYYKSLGEKAMAQLEPEQLFILPYNDGNSIAIIVQHMAGNMLSRWTDFLNTDGEKEWRDRDNEFEIILTERDDVLRKWEEGWGCLQLALDSLKPEQLEDIILIRNEPHTIVQAINRQLAHYPYHVGQIVFYAKYLTGSKFKSLSIPKHKSAEFNKEKFKSVN